MRLDDWRANKLRPVSTCGFWNRKSYFGGKTDVQIAYEKVYWVYEGCTAAEQMTSRMGARAETGSRNMAVRVEIESSTPTSFDSPKFPWNTSVVFVANSTIRTFADLLQTSQRQVKDKSPTFVPILSSMGNSHQKMLNSP